jgi:hypothetical protein
VINSPAATTIRSEHPNGDATVVAFEVKRDHYICWLCRRPEMSADKCAFGSHAPLLRARWPPQVAGTQAPQCLGNRASRESHSAIGTIFLGALKAPGG